MEQITACSTNANANIDTALQLRSLSFYYLEAHFCSPALPSLSSPLSFFSLPCALSLFLAFKFVLEVGSGRAWRKGGVGDRGFERGVGKGVEKAGLKRESRKEGKME